jgi:HlyD family secretion protein
MKKTTSMRLSFIIAFFLLFVLAACSGSAPTGQADPQNEPAVLEAVKSSSSIIAEGRVVPLEEAVLSFTAPGVIDEVFVQEGEQVEAGQTIARLMGNEQLEAAIAAAEMQVLTAEQELANLKDTASLERAQAQLAIVEARKELDKIQKRKNSQDYQHGNQDQVDIARAHYVMAEDGVENATQLYDLFDHLSEEDPNRAEAFSQLAAARQQRDKALANLNWLLAKPNDLDIAEIDAQMALVQAKLADAEARFETLKDGPDASKVSLLQARLASAQAQLKAARSSLSDLELLAPFAGTISSIQIAGGEFVSPGMAVAKLSDQSEWLIRTTDLTELNVARIQPGMPAMIRFDAVPDLEVIGRVLHVENFGENRQGDIVYTVVLKLEQPEPRLRWNMSAMVTFVEKVE